MISTQEIKEVIDNIKKEQDEKGLNDIERLKDWEEKYIFRSEQLVELKKDLEKKTAEASFWEEYKEKVKWQSYENLLVEEREKIRILDIKNSWLEEQHKQHEKKIKELKRSKEASDENCDRFNKEGLEDKGKLKKLEKELKEKKLIIEKLEEKNQLIVQQELSKK